MSIIIWLIMGGITGWLASIIAKKKSFGLVGNIILGIVGATIGGFLFGLVGFTASSLIGSLITSFLGALVLLFIIDLIRKSLRLTPSQPTKAIATPTSSPPSSRSLGSPTVTTKGKIPKSQAVEFLDENTLEENDVVLAIEEIPLDNRFGNSKLTSTHEFTRTATTSFDITKNNEVMGRLKAGSWSVIEIEAQKRISERVGVEVGDQITRRVNVTFEAAPGEIVYYRLTWKQKTRQGVFNMKVNNQTIHLPYSVTYGLYHLIESVSSGK